MSNMKNPLRVVIDCNTLFPCRYGGSGKSSGVVDGHILKCDTACPEDHGNYKCCFFCSTYNCHRYSNDSTMKLKMLAKINTINKSSV